MARAGPTVHRAPRGYTQGMTESKKTDPSTTEAARDVQSDPAAGAESNDWSSEGGAIETGPATDDERSDGQ